MIRNLQCINLLNYSALLCLCSSHVLSLGRHFEMISWNSDTKKSELFWHSQWESQDEELFKWIFLPRGQISCDTHLASEAALGLGQKLSGSGNSISLEWNASARCSALKSQIKSGSETMRDTQHVPALTIDWALCSYSEHALALQPRSQG